MAITSELIGKLGGADVEVTPVEMTQYDRNDRYEEELLHTVEVPAGETWMVAMEGYLKVTSVGSQSPQLKIGDTISPQRAPSGAKGLAHIGTGTVEIKVVRNGGRSDAFTGHVYTFKL